MDSIHIVAHAVFRLRFLLSIPLRFELRWNVAQATIDVLAGNPAIFKTNATKRT